ncbi:MAG: cation transporter, partial [Betaproteobacteria bacterium]|nr:cation transporter [Betaproteobacteria bacterium]
MQLATAAWDDPLEADDFTRFDHPTAGLAASHLALDGLRCAACAVTIEAALARQPGVQTAEVNVASRRLHLVWRPGAARLSTLVQAVESAGYRVYPARHIAQEHERARERRTALWRLFVAGFAMMQVMMYALPLYVA